MKVVMLACGYGAKINILKPTKNFKKCNILIIFAWNLKFVILKFLKNIKIKKILKVGFI